MTRSLIAPFALTLVTSLVACGGGGAADDSSSDGEGALTQSRVPSQAERETFKPVVALGKCTATKVGPRHFLTAAHCVLSNEGMAAAGEQISIEMSNYQDVVIKRVERQRWPTIEKVVVDQSWLEKCKDLRYTSTCRDVEFTKKAGGGDIALVVVKDEAPPTESLTVNHSVRDIPSMPVLARSLAKNDAVVLAGYGDAVKACGNDPTSVGDSMLKVWELRVSQSKVIDGTGRPQPVVTDFDLLKDHFVFSDAQSALCHGDSGGPVLVKVNGRFAVAGIHAGYTFGADGKTLANWHTRLDAAAKINLADGEKSMADWLEREAVDVLR